VVCPGIRNPLVCVPERPDVSTDGRARVPESAVAVQGGFDALCDGVVECVRTLSRAVEAHGSDPAAFAQARERIDDLEATCTDHARETRERLARADGLETVGLYLAVGDLLAHATALERVADLAESFVRDLGHLGDALEDTGTLAAMAERLEGATAALTTATMTVIRAQCRADGCADVEAAIDRVRALESGADDLRDEALAASFADGVDVDAMATRELVCALDDTVDATETAADELAQLAAQCE
jgi:uncharacterized protein Yka (UPF0111/DUF47 family)